jgi:hypothetical protein
MLSSTSRTFSTPVWLAASISCTSIELDAAISRHGEHSPHGSGVGPRSQLRDFARIRAIEVFPMPRGPERRIA